MSENKTSLPDLLTCKVAVIGLGYVGLPLAVEISKSRTCLRTGSLLSRSVVGFDINNNRLNELKLGYDRNAEISLEDFQCAKSLSFTSNPLDLVDSDVFIITVPTPIDSSKRPDLTALSSASSIVGQALKARSSYTSRNSKSFTLPLVIYESTVFPCATEEVCVPILVNESGLTYNHDFFCGYSPERINPGDKVHTLPNIVKVTSASSAESSIWVDQFYASFIAAGTFLASSLQVAEAAKVIENTQRDLNIALVNEFAMIFSRMGIDTLDVLEAAGTKWNFLPFRPGLVGGHCIGVDPYYLTHKAEQLGYHPHLLLAGRRINDGMAHWIVDRLVLEMASSGMVIAGSKVLVLGLTFKENCPDLRNSRVFDLISALHRYALVPCVVDPCADLTVLSEDSNNLFLSKIPYHLTFSAVILAVSHKEFIDLSIADWSSLLSDSGIFIDLKGVIPRSLNPVRL